MEKHILRKKHLVVNLCSAAILLIIATYSVWVLRGTIDDCEMVEGLVLTQRVCTSITRVEKAKIGLIQFCLSPPKTDVSSQAAHSTTTPNDQNVVFTS